MIDFLFSKIGSAQFVTFIISMLPVLELRGAMPIALTYFNLPFWSAFFWSVLGNILPAIFLIFFLEKISNYLMHKNYWFNRFFSWLFEKTRRRHNHHFEIWGPLALVFFVAIPLPFTGAWSGAVAAFVFGISPRHSVPCVIIGVLLAGLLVGTMTLGIIKLPDVSF